MPAQLVESHPLVEETTNQVAVKRGPIVYCLESADLPKDVRVGSVTIPADAELSSRYDANLLDGVGIVETTAVATSPVKWNGELYRPKQVTATTDIYLRLIPYYAWANRGAGEMSVWLPLK
jgi:DUF1680 family protein